MHTVGSYITKGAKAVSAHSHLFDGAVDIIVVKQQDESFKSSPWYVRFGKFQGLSKAKDKVVTISVNGVKADFHMYLDHKGEAYFCLREETEAENTLESSEATVRRKKLVRVLTPTPEQLASLNLKEGKNTASFALSTAKQVDARIYLWKWDTRVVISDVDGTITKSDVLGHLMHFLGMDWSQPGVVRLFSAIKENGYQLLFLSARAISHAYHTRRFLNLVQDGNVLPDGPAVFSRDGHLTCFSREVTRVAHEFKIPCLEDIKALFPSDRNPFYAGFGNRETDKRSYRGVGIPPGKIFIINPKGEVVVKSGVDSEFYNYTSLHTHVHVMFPPMSSSE